MPNAVRRMLAVVAGLVVAVAVVLLGDFVASRLWTPPSGTDLAGADGLRAAMASIPRRALVAVLLGWVAAAAAGAFVATRVSPARGRVHGHIVTVLLLAATIANLLAIPHPAWVWVGAVVLIPVAGWLAARAAASPEPVRPRHP
ncbi:MAG TPA: hypothetical protein VNK43_07505 [Gemmatimonadales bacterium]|nr:hypothetical protein [Gemmatimonadales bacterium]